MPAMPDPEWASSLRAENHATDSANLIHDDTVAASYGFRGGLVPGVDVYAYLTAAPVRVWGRDWLQSGAMACKFLSPVYDGDQVTVEGSPDGDGVVDLRLRNGAGEVCATATATRRATVERPEPSAWPAGAVASRGAPASAESLAVGTALVPIEVGFHAEKASAYLAEIGEPSSLYSDERVAHPGWLLRFANYVLADHVRLGPWIHVASDVWFFGLVPDGARVETRAVVTDEYERKGHRFVVLDVLVTADGRPAQRVTHTAIHTPRPHSPSRPEEI